MLSLWFRAPGWRGAPPRTVPTSPRKAPIGQAPDRGRTGQLCRVLAPACSPTSRPRDEDMPHLDTECFTEGVVTPSLCKGRAPARACRVPAGRLGCTSRPGFTLIWGTGLSPVISGFSGLQGGGAGNGCPRELTGRPALTPFARDRHEADAECVHYILGPTGTRVGCHFDQLGKPQRTDNYFFLVNGTSRETAIPFLDFTPFKAVQIGKSRPPSPCVWLAVQGDGCLAAPGGGGDASLIRVFLPRGASQPSCAWEYKTRKKTSPLHS